jgi:hypothetical protein
MASRNHLNTKFIDRKAVVLMINSSNCLKFSALGSNLISLLRYLQNNSTGLNSGEYFGSSISRTFFEENSPKTISHVASPLYIQAKSKKK